MEEERRILVVRLDDAPLPQPRDVHARREREDHRGRRVRSAHAWVQVNQKRLNVQRRHVEVVLELWVDDDKGTVLPLGRRTPFRWREGAVVLPLFELLGARRLQRQRALATPDDLGLLGISMQGLPVVSPVTMRHLRAVLHRAAVALALGARELVDARPLRRRQYREHRGRVGRRQCLWAVQEVGDKRGGGDACE